MRRKKGLKLAWRRESLNNLTKLTTFRGSLGNTSQLKFLEHSNLKARSERTRPHEECHRIEGQPYMYLNKASFVLFSSCVVGLVFIDSGCGLESVMFHVCACSPSRVYFFPPCPADHKLDWQPLYSSHCYVYNVKTT